MGAGLTAVGTLSYNGYTFSGASTVRCNIEFVKDDAGRTTKMNRYTLDVKTTIVGVASGTTDNELANIRVLLSKQGGPLVFANRGLAEIRVNTPGGQQDMAWGPIPEVLTWESIGSSQACDVTWRVTFCLPDCSTNRYHSNTGLMSAGFEVDYRINERGFTTRTVTGHLEIGMTRRSAGSTTIPDCADLYRHLVQIATPPNFQRSQSYKTNLSKTRLDYTVTDTEIESANPWPNWVTKITARHRTSVAGGYRGAVKQRHNITAQIELMRGVDPALMWEIFRAICGQRIAAAFAGVSESASMSSPSIFLDELSAEEDIFGFSGSFSLGYHVLQTPEFLLTNSGLWKPLGTNWSSWQSTMQSVFKQRGLTGMVLDPSNDTIVDICRGEPTSPWNPLVPDVPPPPLKKPPFQNTKPPARKSYRDYNMWMRVRRDIRRAKQYKMEGPESSGTTGSTSAAAGGVAVFGVDGGSDAVVQVGTRGGYTFELIGSAERVGWQVPKPKVVAVGGQVPIETNCDFVGGALGKYFGQTLYGAAWRITYDLPNAPGGVDTLPNITQGIS